MPLTADRDVSFFPTDELIDYPMDSNTVIYRGTFVGRNRSSGYARPLLAGDEFLGMAYRFADNSFAGNGPGSAYVRLHRHIDVLHFVSGAGILEVGRDVYASADDTLTLTPTGNSGVGRIMGIDATGLPRVRLHPHRSSEGASGVVGVTQLADASTTLTLDHVGRTLLMANSAARTVTLPSVSLVRAGGWIRFVKTSPAAFAITLDGSGAETIDGAATYAGLDAAYDTLLLFCTGTDWVILSRDIA